MEIISSINLWKFPGIIVVNNHIVLLYQNIVIASNDTDVVVYVLNYACYFQNMVKKIWIQYGASDKTRFIPVHINVSLALIQAVFHVDDHFWVQENWHPNN